MKKYSTAEMAENAFSELPDDLPPSSSGANEFLEHFGITDVPAHSESRNGPHASVRQQGK